MATSLRDRYMILRFYQLNYIISDSFEYFLRIVTNNRATYTTNTSRAMDTALGHAYMRTKRGHYQTFIFAGDTGLPRTR